MHVPPGTPVPSRVKLQLSTVETRLTTHHSLASFPFMTHFPSSLLAFPEIYSQRTTRTQLLAPGSGTPNPRQMPTQLLAQTQSPSHLQAASHPRHRRLNTSGSPRGPHTAFLRNLISWLENLLFFPTSFPSPAFSRSLVPNRSSPPHPPTLRPLQLPLLSLLFGLHASVAGVCGRH